MPAEYSVIILADNRVSAIQTWLRGSLAGRALLLGALVKSVTLTLGAIVPQPSLPIEAIDTVADVCLVAGALLLLYRLWVAAKRRLLWRVRRKLTLSYIFIGFVPVLLLITFFALCGLLLLFSMSSYLTQSRVAGLVDETQFLAQTTALELPRATDVADFQEMLGRRQAGAARRYRFASYAVVPAERTCEGLEDGSRVAASDLPRAAGPWVHLESPESVPAWIPCAGSAAILAYTESLDSGATDPVETRLVARAVAFPDVREPTYAVVVDIPIGAAMARQMFDDVGIELGSVTVLDTTGAGVSTWSGRRVDDPAAADVTRSAAAERLGGLEWVTFLDFVDWETGETGSLTAAIQLNVLGLYRRISATSIAGIGDLNFGQILLVMLAVVAGLFFVIQIVAFGMGLALARSITGSVHALFVGTGRVRRGDFNHKIPIRSHDQLGELASSFNSMTASMEDLLRQKAEKERLEQELRIAREIQMSLLPQAPPSMPGLALTGYCRPAREVGGDYYDLLPIDEHRLGVLIADVSGKGTSAALYMAELKGVVLALSRLHRSPRQLLIDANRTLAPHLDNRSFITITYALIDLEARTLTYARAGHCPLLYLPGAAPSRDVQVLTPDGMVLGLQIDDGQMFDDQLQEVTLPLSPGDLFVLFTDGITEAMDAAGEYFGDDRLSGLVRQHGHLSVTELRERILEDVEAFVGSAAQQDDMTMLFVRVEDATA